MFPTACAAQTRVGQTNIDWIVCSGAERLEELVVSDCKWYPKFRWKPPYILYFIYHILLYINIIYRLGQFVFVVVFKFLSLSLSLTLILSLSLSLSRSPSLLEFFYPFLSTGNLLGKAQPKKLSKTSHPRSSDQSWRPPITRNPGVVLPSQMPYLAYLSISLTFFTTPALTQFLRPQGHSCRRLPARRGWRSTRWFVS